ncbi:MAG: TetR/AcrR family transcriptional regulator [Alphaproteobacteria bacterium]|nr:TetR/AcrR family transcriptional regulator [Alphaproteobacteria bacterium]
MPKTSVTKKSKSTPINDLPPKRRAILHAAYEVLMEQGYAGARTLEIATRARVSKRELYAEFGTKRGILEALVAAGAARMQVPLTETVLTDRASLVDALVRYGTNALAELSTPPVLAVNRLAIAEAGSSPDLGRILDEVGRAPNRAALIDLFRRARAAGLVGRGDPDTMSGQFFSLLWVDLMMRLLLGVARPPDAREIRRRAEAATDAVLRLHPTDPPDAAR